VHTGLIDLKTSVDGARDAIITNNFQGVDTLAVVTASIGGAKQVIIAI